MRQTGFIGSVFASIAAHKMVVAGALVVGFFFYWYEVRPIVLYRTCAVESSGDARALLASKAEIAKGTERGRSYEDLMAKNMYLRSDYESFLNKCLLFYGMRIEKVDSAEAERAPTE